MDAELHSRNLGRSRLVKPMNDRLTIAMAVLPNMMEFVANSTVESLAELASKKNISPERERIIAWLALNQADALLEELAARIHGTKPATHYGTDTATD